MLQTLVVPFDIFTLSLPPLSLWSCMPKRLPINCAYLFQRMATFASCRGWAGRFHHADSLISSVLNFIVAFKLYTYVHPINTFPDSSILRGSFKAPGKACVKMPNSLQNSKWSKWLCFRMKSSHPDNLAVFAPLLLEITFHFFLVIAAAKNYCGAAHAKIERWCGNGGLHLQLARCATVYHVDYCRAKRTTSGIYRLGLPPYLRNISAVDFLQLGFLIYSFTYTEREPKVHV